MLITDYYCNCVLNPEWDPIEFEPQSERSQILRQPVECIRAICLTPREFNFPNTWTFFLSTSEVNMTAVRLHCQPTYVRQPTVLEFGSKANIVFQKRSTLVPPNGQLTFVLSVNPGFTVGDIHEMIVANNRHKFEIDDDGWNGRTWVYDQIDLFNQHGILANQDEVALCDEKKPACSKCIHHAIECDFLSTTSISPASSSAAPPPSRPSKTQFRFKPSKYQPEERAPKDETSQPSSQTVSTEVQRESSSAIPQIQDTLSFADLRLFHHFVTETYRTITDEATDHKRIWQTHVPQWGFTLPSIFHLILALAALHLGYLHPEVRDQYVMQADDHFTFGIRSVSAILSSLNSGNCQSIYMSTVLVCFVYFAHGPKPGEYLVFSETGKAEWLVLMRGVRSILMSSHDKIFTGVLEIQPDPAIQGVSHLLQDELGEHQSRIQQLQRFIETQTSGSSTGQFYIGALEKLLQMFEEAYQCRSAGKDGVHLMPFVVGWIYTRPEEFISLLEAKEPLSLVVLAYWSILLKFMGSSWLMIGWDRHVIAGIRECLALEFHQWIEWPVSFICD
ncbi:hypothetical protein N7519_004243 [Penicillium mononematosum]|uniref:uncharacterized protein n=1 Tax=Penicillium mononematosum TaxID=268346 RepID=UPI002548FD5F|nr:uncharacterized protein N7519_004243 [Penicillium mononematosum]KAJ6189335.1 hypothetical protein N7519_004243 [Penicillium mononematosum]